MTTPTEPLPPSSAESIAATTQRMRQAFENGVLANPEHRRAALERLETAITQERESLTEALRIDLGKSDVEAWTTEIGFTLGQIKHALAELDRWRRPRKVPLKLQLRPGRARLQPTPLGTVCVIAPWNYPVQLVLAPVVAALAAGNTIVVKPSEIAPATERAVTGMLERHLSDVIGVVNGGAEATTVLLQERFDHIFYTGNGRVGRIVMRAAAEHLTPVTLELGGKSPAIVTESADIDISARRIAWGKFINAGQTCVAPDYVLIPSSLADRFTAALSTAIDEFFGADPRLSPDYGRIVNTHHLTRLQHYLNPDNGRIALGGQIDVADRYLSPTVLRDVPPTAPVMDDEIFGPVLPIITVENVDGALAEIRSRPHPLALYLFSTSVDEQQQVLAATHSGGVLINHTLLHLAAEDLPFGGIGESGMGSYHGQAGFDTFSHLRPVMWRPMKPDPRLLYPPYGRLKQRLLERFL